MGISLYSVRTYFVHQSKFLFPAILTYWERYRATPVNELKEKREVIWRENGRFDSMGHSAKYGAYTVFCCALDVGLLHEVVHSMLHNISAPMHAGITCNKLVAILAVSNAFCCFLRQILHGGSGEQPIKRHN